VRFAGQSNAGIERCSFSRGKERPRRCCRRPEVIAPCARAHCRRSTSKLFPSVEAVGTQKRDRAELLLVGGRVVGAANRNESRRPDLRPSGNSGCFIIIPARLPVPPLPDPRRAMRPPSNRLEIDSPAIAPRIAVRPGVVRRAGRRSPAARITARPPQKLLRPSAVLDPVAGDEEVLGGSCTFARCRARG